MIHIITTGGTIEGLDYSEEKNKIEGNKISIEDFFKSANVSFRYVIFHYQLIHTRNNDQIQNSSR